MSVSSPGDAETLAPANERPPIRGARWFRLMGRVVVLLAGLALLTLPPGTGPSPAAAAGQPAVLRAVVNVGGASVTIQGPGLAPQTCTQGFYPNPDPAPDLNRTCTNLFSEGDLVTLTAKDDQPGAVFVGWSDDRCPAAPSTTCKLALTTQQTIVALFSPVTIAVQANGWSQADRVDLTDATGQTCSAQLDLNAPPRPCSFPLGSVVTAVATGVAGQPPSWNSGDCDAEPKPGANGLSAVCTITVSGDQVANVGFGADAPPDAPPRANVTVRVSHTGPGAVHGAVDCGRTCAVDTRLGQLITIIADADPGSHFVRWDGGCGTMRVCRLFAAGNPVAAEFAPDAQPPPRFQATLDTVTVTRRGHRRVVRIALRVNAPARVRARLSKGPRLVASGVFPATPATSRVLGLPVPPGTPSGRYNLALTISDPTGGVPISVARGVRLPG